MTIAGTGASNTPVFVGMFRLYRCGACYPTERVWANDR